jgi:ABC-type sugar transport system ATPase subunit
MSSDTILQVVGINKRFGAHQALDDVSFEMRRGEIVALLGDNGAGKSTVVKVLAGVHEADSGEIVFDGEKVELKTPAQSQALGIGVVYQDLALFDNLTVAENFFAGREVYWPRRLGGLGLVNSRQMRDRAADLLENLEVRIPNINSTLALMSGGQRQAVAVARAVAFATKLVILDEPTAALGIRESSRLIRVIRRLPETGISVLLITHNMNHVLELADRAVVLRQGVKQGEVKPSRETQEQIVSMIVGSAARVAI